MRSSPRSAAVNFCFLLAWLMPVLALPVSSFASAYDGRPKLVVNRTKVVQMADVAGDDMTTREIGEELGISAASVCRILKTMRAGVQA